MNVDGGFQIQDLRGLLRRRGKVMGASALVLVLATYWLAMALPNVYTSYATVLVEPQAVDAELVKAGVAESDLNRRLHLMTAEILSRPRLSRIIDELDLYRDESESMTRDQVIDLMRNQVRVEPVIPELEQQGIRRTQVEVNEFKIYYDNYDRTLARDVTQRLANDFIETHIDERVRTSQKSLEFIEGELERLATDIQGVEAEISRVKGENPGRLPEDMDANQRKLERLLSDLSRVRGDYAEAASDEAFYASQAAAAKALGGAGPEASPIQRLEVLKLELTNNLSRGFTDKHPDVVRAREEIAQLERLIAESGGDTGPTLDPLAQQNEAAARRAALRRASAEEEIRRLEAMTEEFRNLIEGTPQVAEQLDGLNRRYEHLFNTYQDFSARHNEAVVQAQLERRQLGEQFRVLEAAFEADEPSAPNRLLIFVLGGVFAMGAGVGVGLLMEATDTSPHDARQLQDRIRLPVLAQIPQIWLESDRVRQRRARIRTALATTGLVVFALVGGAANYFWVNGMPGFFEAPPVAAGQAARASEGEG